MSLKLYARSILSLLWELCLRILTYIKPTPYTPRSLAILRTDAIGDYLLFRAFLAEVRHAYPDHHITLIGNNAWRSLCDYFDSAYCDSYIWLDIAKLHKSYTPYAIATLRNIKRTTYTILINPIHSRDHTNTRLAKHIYARIKIAPQGDDVNMSPQYKPHDTTIYTTLTPSAKDIMFEFYRNKEFFQHLLQKPLHTSPKLQLRNPPTPIINAKLYSVLFIGASAQYRQWSVEYFAEVGKHLMQQYGHDIVICGGNADVESGAKLTQILKHIAQDCTQSIHNLTGKTTLVELACLVYNGNLLVSNETSAVHLAALLDTTIIIVVYNGNHLGRFIPYPKEIRDKYYPVFHPFITTHYDNYKELSNAFAYKSTLNINDIAPKQVIDLIDHIYTRSDNE